MNTGILMSSHVKLVLMSHDILSKRLKITQPSGFQHYHERFRLERCGSIMNLWKFLYYSAIKYVLIIVSFENMIFEIHF